MTQIVKDQIFNRLTKKYGYPPHIAEGILMNIEDESGFNPEAIGDNGNAYGLVQHNGPRMRGYKNYAANLGVSPADVDTQADYIVHELNTTESKANKALLGTKSAGEAADVFLRQFERPAQQHVDSRSAKYLGGSGSGYTPAPAGAEPDIQIGGVTGDPYSNGMALAPTQAQEPKPELKGFSKWVDDKMPWLNQDRGDMFLAIGQGLLSGNNWSEGMASASGNLMGVNQSHRERDASAAAGRQEQERWEYQQAAARAQHEEKLAQERALKEMDMQAVAAKAQAEKDAKGPQSVIFNNKEIGGVRELIIDPETGRRHVKFTESMKADEQKSFGYTEAAIDGMHDMDAAVVKAGGVGGLNVSQITQSMNSIASMDGKRSIIGANLKDFMMKDLGIQDEATVQFLLAATKVGNAKLRRDTGAAITVAELNDMLYRYVPQSGDTEDTIAFKNKTMQDDINIMINSSPEFTKDYLYNAFTGTFKPVGQEVTSQKLPEPAKPNPIQISDEERAKLVTEKTEQRKQEVRQSFPMPDKVKKAGVTQADWDDTILAIEYGNGSLTYDDLIQEYGLSMQDLAALGIR